MNDEAPAKKSCTFGIRTRGKQHFIHDAAAKGGKKSPPPQQQALLPIQLQKPSTPTTRKEKNVKTGN
ncbi:MAG: hypothetical protein Q3X95_02980 [Duodenibacillus sp.]|nr:hypothetical protein [Duodenibacillus sp.]